MDTPLCFPSEVNNKHGKPCNIFNIFILKLPGLCFYVEDVHLTDHM